MACAWESVICVRLREHVMHTSHFWQSAGLLAIIFGAAVLSAMIGSRANAAEAYTPTISSTQAF